MVRQQSNLNTGDGQGLSCATPILNELLELLAQCAGAFKQSRSGVRAINFMLGLLLAPSRKTCMASRYYRNLASDESADYKVFSRSNWDVRDWFQVVLKEVLQALPLGDPLVVAMDDTGLRKWGRDIPQARYIYDPLALKWLKQRFAWGIRVLHLAALIPFEYQAGRPYAIPLGFYPKPAAKKPRGKGVGEEELAAYQAAKKATLLTTEGRKEIAFLRRSMDSLDQGFRKLIVVVDGSFMNGPVAKVPILGVELIGRVRSTIRLREKCPAGNGRAFYGDPLPTPEQYRLSPDLAWRQAVLFNCGEPRLVKFKEVSEVYWKDGTAKRPMRLFIIAGNPYTPRSKRANRNRKRKKYYFREHGYLLTTDLQSNSGYLIQQYLNRWQIEDTHRSLKSGLGAAHPQNTNFQSVERIPSALVATYSLLMLSVLKILGPKWDSSVVPQTSGARRRMLRRKATGKPTARRFSNHDHLMLLRNEVEKAGIFASQTRPRRSPKGWVLSLRDSFGIR